jgi:hypothetical protein
MQTDDRIPTQAGVIKMSIIRRIGILALALVVMLATGGATAFAKGYKNKGGDKERHVRGTVTAADCKSITVETKKHGSQQFRLTSATIVEKVGKKGQTKPAKQTTTGKASKRGKAGKASKIKTGSRVVVTAKGDTAKKVAVKKRGHKSKQR